MCKFNCMVFILMLNCILISVLLGLANIVGHLKLYCILYNKEILKI